MSAINEAYARIDYAVIQGLQNEIDELKRSLNAYSGFAKIKGDLLSVKNTRVFARTVQVPSNSNNTIKVEFGSGTFSGIPVVTASVLDPTPSKTDLGVVTVIMKSLSKSSVTMEITRTGKGAMVLHVIAVGERP